MSDQVASYLRTAVPVAWGWLLTQLVLVLPSTPGYVVDALSTPQAITAVTAAVTLLWYVAWRRVEPHVPDWLSRIAMGSAKMPTYRALTSYPTAHYSTDDVVRLTDGAIVTVGAITPDPGAGSALYEIEFPSGKQGMVHDRDIAGIVRRAG
jgi:hypothetical protein